MKLIVLIFGLRIGFGFGIYVGVHYPTDAAGIAAKQDEWYMKGKMEATQAIKDKLDKVLSQQTKPAAPGLSFAGGASRAAAAPTPSANSATSRTRKSSRCRRRWPRKGSNRRAARQRPSDSAPAGVRRTASRPGARRRVT